MRYVAAAVLLGTGRIDLEVAISQKKERPRSSGFLRRMSVLRVVNSSKEGISSGTIG